MGVMMMCQCAAHDQVQRISGLCKSCQSNFSPKLSRMQSKTCNKRLWWCFARLSFWASPSAPLRVNSAERRIPAFVKWNTGILRFAQN